MFYVSLKIVIRNFLNNKGFSIINILGLTLGLSVSLLTFLWTYNELSFDKFNINFRHIVQFQQRIYFDKEKYTSDRCGGAIGPELSKKFPEIESFVRFGSLNGEILLSYIPSDKSQNRVNIIEKNGLAADSTVFGIFTYPRVRGNPVKALNMKNSIVLTEREAEKFFGHADPIGKILMMNELIPLEVTGVIRQIPVNSNIQFSFLLPFGLLNELTSVNDSYEGTSYNTYFQIKPMADYKALNSSNPG